MNLPPYGDAFRRVNSFLSTLRVTSIPDPCMRVEVSSGGFWINSKKYIEYKGGVSPDIISPTVNSKWVLVTINYNGQIKIIDGEQSSQPVFPDCTNDCFPLAAIYLNRTDTKITSDKIFDIRGIFNVTSLRHSDLIDKNDIDSHTTLAITGLEERLNNFVSFNDVRNILLEKADSDGTNNTVFILNKDQTGIPTSDVSLMVNRGSNPSVFIRWNEGLRCWEYTNDGSITVQLTSIGPTLLNPPASTTTLGVIKVGENLNISIDGKLDAVVQSDENFTNLYKTKLDGIQDEANKYVHPNTHLASMITQEFGLRFMTDTEKAKLSSVEDLANHYVHPVTHPPEIVLQDLNHRFVTDIEKTKLAGIEDHANRYVHPNTHPASIIIEDPNKRFISETDLIKLAGIQENANNYIHPAFHTASMITSDENRRFVSDEQINVWNNKIDSSYVETRLSEIIGAAPSVLNTLEELATAISDDANFASNMAIELNKKVDKITGMGLSQTSFTTLEKNKLSTIQDFANNYIHPTTHPANIIVEDTSRRFVSDLEKQKISNLPTDTISQLATKVDKDGLKQLSDQNYTLTEKNKLATIQEGANLYTHPSTHSATIINQDTTHRFVTDLQISEWNNKDSYTSANVSHWNGAPSTIQEAINRLAEAVFTLRGNVAI